MVAKTNVLITINNNYNNLYSDLINMSYSKAPFTVNIKKSVVLQHYFKHKYMYKNNSSIRACDISR